MRKTQSSVISETQLPVRSIGAPARGLAGGAAGAAARRWAKAVLVRSAVNSAAANERHSSLATAGVAANPMFPKLIVVSAPNEALIASTDASLLIERFAFL